MNSVARELDMSSRSSREARLLAVHTLAPTRSGHRSPPIDSNVWWSGRMLRNRSAGPNSSVRTTASTLESRFACESITPFAWPVVPEVKSSTARSCGSALCGGGSTVANSRCAWSQWAIPASGSSETSRRPGRRAIRAASRSGRWRASPIACVASADANSSPSSCSRSWASSGTTTAPAASTDR